MPGVQTRRVRQMRLVVEAGDYESVVRFYRDVLGAEQELQVHGEDGERVTILDVGRATLELSNPKQVAMIDRVEVGRRVSPKLRVAFEVADVRDLTNHLVAAGAELVAPPTPTPWESLNSRLDTPGGLQITLFEELAGQTGAANTAHAWSDASAHSTDRSCSNSTDRTSKSEGGDL